MAFEGNKTFFSNSFETSDNIDKEYATHYYRNDYSSIKDAIKQVAHKMGYTVTNVDDQYKELLLALIQEKTHVYSKRTRRFHLSGMLCEMFAMLNQLVPDYYRKGINHSRSSLIVRDFIDLVNADDGTHRSVGYYADKLCYSPKHLCAIIKQTTGKTPMQIIQENAIKQIKYKLKHSEMSIKEIAADFDFPNPSFFGKFVKIHTGMTPMEYRMQEEKDIS